MTRWCFVHHDPGPESGAWTLPRGFAAALHQQGVHLWRVTFPDPARVVLPSCEEIRQRGVEVLLVFYAGRSASLEQELLRLRLGTDVLIVNELGDEPQTRALNAVRVQLSHLCLTPDAGSAAHWQALGARCAWFTHWADTALFHRQPGVQRQRRIVTTVGRRRYARLLRLVFGPAFVNRRCSGAENTELYNTGLIAFQYARWGELTRRVFEAAACGCCVVTNRLPADARLDQLFPEGQAIVVYNHAWDLLGQLWALLRHPDQAKAIGARGQAIVEQGHTQHVRAQQLLALVAELKVEGLR
jgi:hypothetical protein